MPSRYAITIFFIFYTISTGNPAIIGSKKINKYHLGENAPPIRPIFRLKTNFRPPAIMSIEVLYYTCPILREVLLPPKKYC